MTFGHSSIETKGRGKVAESSNFMERVINW